MRDPQFNAQTVEDRVSSLFWRRRAAEMGSGTECRDIGVGSVQLTMAQSTPLNDVLTFTVVWSAIESGNQCATNLQSQFTLERAIGVQTDAAQGFLSLRCAGCGSGAVGRPDDGDHCAHCGSTLADKSREWVLTLVKENLRQQKRAA